MLEEIFDIEEITLKHLQDDKRGPLIIQLYKKIKSENSSTGVYLILITTYAKPLFRDFQSCLRIILGNVVGLNENDFQLILKQYNSKLVTYEMPPGVYSIKDVSEVVDSTDHKGTLTTEYDYISLKRKLILSFFAMLGFNEKSLCYTLLGFTPFLGLQTY